MLETHLIEIDSLIAVKAPTVAAGLRPGANAAALERLQRACLDGRSVDDDLARLFRWHDGQIGYSSLGPLDNRMLQSIDEVIDTWLFLSDPMEDIMPPWDPAWLPILANGAGDYLVYVTSGDSAGALLAWWHDAADRDVEYPSLAAWAEAMRDAYLAAPAPPSPVDVASR